MIAPAPVGAGRRAQAEIRPGGPTGEALPDAGGESRSTEKTSVSPTLTVHPWRSTSAPF